MADPFQEIMRRIRREMPQEIVALVEGRDCTPHDVFAWDFRTSYELTNEFISNVLEPCIESVEVNTHG